jgi:hypothetical protein
LSERGGGLAVASLPERGTPPLERTEKVARTGLERTTGNQPDRLLRLAAERRVERFLAGFGMARGRRRELVIQNCLAQAVARWQEQPGSDLRALALQQAEDALSRWFTAVLGPELIGEHPPLLVGRAAFEICGAASSWPGVLATRERLPPAAVAAIQQAGFMPTPAEAPGSMVAQPLEWWSAKELLTYLGGLLTRLGRGPGGRPASAA